MSKERFKGFSAGILVVILIFTMTLTAFGSVVTQTITAYYNDIKIYVNDKMIEPKDVSGKVVEPFIYDGTTYLPLRALAEALGQDVEWDGDTYSVYISENPDEISAVLIYSWEDLNNIRNNLKKNYILMEDLDMDSTDYDMYAGNSADGGKGWLPIGDSVENAFMGDLYGNGHIISETYML